MTIFYIIATITIKLATLQYCAAMLQYRCASCFEQIAITLTSCCLTATIFKKHILQIFFLKQCVQHLLSSCWKKFFFEGNASQYCNVACKS